MISISSGGQSMTSLILRAGRPLMMRLDEPLRAQAGRVLSLAVAIGGTECTPVNKTVAAKQSLPDCFINFPLLQPGLNQVSIGERVAWIEDDLIAGVKTISYFSCCIVHVINRNLGLVRTTVTDDKNGPVIAGPKQR